MAVDSPGLSAPKQTTHVGQLSIQQSLVKFTLLTRDTAPYLVDRYSERKESAEELSKRVNQKAI